MSEREKRREREGAWVIAGDDLRPQIISHL
jgi:hypothetical protein